MLRRASIFFVAALAALAMTRPAFAASVATAGDLVKCPDFPSVYYLGDDGGRYVFPNESIFYSWYDGFEHVTEISCDDLASLPLRGAVHYQAGSSLVKIQSDPTVYAVEDDGTLRALESESQAEALYGDDWTEEVDDLPDAFFGQYDVEDPLEDGEIPDGMIVGNDDGKLYRSQDGVFVEMDELVSDEATARYERFARRMDEVEQAFLDRFGIDLSFETLDAQTAGTFLSDLLRAMHPIVVDEADREDVEIPELEDANETDDSQTEDTTEDGTESESEFETDTNHDGVRDWWSDKWKHASEQEDWATAAFEEWSGRGSDSSQDDSSDDTADTSDDASDASEGGSDDGTGNESDGSGDSEDVGGETEDSGEDATDGSGSSSDDGSDDSGSESSGGSSGDSGSGGGSSGSGGGEDD